MLKLKEIFGIVVADVFDHLTHAVDFGVGNFAVFDVATYQVAESAAEVFVTRVGEETARGRGLSEERVLWRLVEILKLLLALQ